MTSPTRELVERIPQVGRVRWIGVRPERREPMQVLGAVEAVVDRGLRGDRRFDRRPVPRAPRQVTIFQHEHLAVVASMLGQSDDIDPAVVRRNIVVSGINLLGLKGRKVAIGGAVLEVTGPCHPCSRMEEALGDGGFQAMRGHGGWCALVIGSGTIALDDEVRAAGPA